MHRIVQIRDVRYSDQVRLEDDFWKTYKNVNNLLLQNENSVFTTYGQRKRVFVKSALRTFNRGKMFETALRLKN